ncbi:hypothetical protein [Dactylosporangium cerinum]
MRVTFEGSGAGSGPLSWGQLDIWLKMTAVGHAMAMGGVRPLPPGTTLDDVAGELRFLMSRYECLRTRLVPDGDGPPRQVVHGSGSIELEVLDHVDAGTVEARFRDAPSTTPTSGRSGWPSSATAGCAATSSWSCPTSSWTAPARCS